jgi:peptide/nickel transport system substrate-binding protein
MKTRMTRRKFLYSSALATVGVVAAGCTQAPAPIPPPATQAPAKATEAQAPVPEASEAAVKESPMLADLVKAGKLPPLEQRLPVDPLVVNAGMRITKEELPELTRGKLGGNFKYSRVGAFDGMAFLGSCEPLVMGPSLTVDGLFANVCKDYKAEDGNKQFTFTLRKGMKWSDGEPVTTKDVSFVMDDLYNHPDWPGGVPGFLKSATGQAAVVKIIDDFTFAVTFDVPYGGFLSMLALASWNSYQDYIKPLHFLKDFHPKYADKAALKKLLDDKGYKENEWPRLMTEKDVARWDMQQPKAIGFPMLTPWVITEEASDGTRTFVRNPYYWKVDAWGQQLPYFDKLLSRRTENVSGMQTLLLGGENDVGGEDPKMAFSYKKKSEEGEFKFQTHKFHVNGVFFFGLSNNDPVMGPVLRDVRFRKAVAAAINYDEMATSAFLGFSTTPDWGASATVNPQGDLSQAESLLDEMGMKKDKDGNRMTPDGKPFVFTIEAEASNQAWFGPCAELIGAQLKGVGIQTELRINEDPSLAMQNITDEKMMGRVQFLHRPEWSNGVFTDYCNSNFGSWDTYSNAKATGSKTIPDVTNQPPAEFYRLYEIREQWKQYLPDAPEAKKLYEEVVKNYTDNAWAIPLSSNDTVPYLQRNTIRNASDTVQMISYDMSIWQMFHEA